MKKSQGLKNNEFSKRAREQYANVIEFVDIENDEFKGVMNVKGAVQRNRKIVKALTSQESDRYLFLEK